MQTLVLLMTLSIFLTGCFSSSFGPPGVPPVTPDPPGTPNPPPGQVPSSGKILGHVVMETLYKSRPLSASSVPGVVVKGATLAKPLADEGGPDYVDSEILARFQENTPQEEIHRIVESQGCHVKQVIDRTDIYVIGIPEREDPVYVAEDFEKNPQVKYAQPNWVGRVTEISDATLTLIPSDPDLSKQWAIEAMGVPYAWDKTTGSSGVKVAVIDTGVQVNHPDLAANIGPGYDFFNNTTDVTDYNGHGTHVAGIIGAIANNGRGIAGINWNVQIMPLKAADNSGQGYLDLPAIIQALYWAANNGADVVNMSFKISDSAIGANNAMDDAIDYAYSKGVTMVAAAGNDGNGRVVYPASHPKVIAVNAVSSDLSRPSWSNYGDGVDVTAPGDLVWSTWPGSTYAYASGTSMAAPQAAGVAALLIAQGIRGQENIRRILQETAMDLGAPGKDWTFGWGMVNAHAAVSGALITNMKVFAGDEDEISITPYSDMVNPKAGGFFEITGVPKGSWYIYGWIDVNNNGAVDFGDYFGRTSGKVVFNGGTLTDIKLLARPIVGSDTVYSLKLGED
ncbi:MAG TPA: S8 family peptidase [Bacillota bacterium]|nr:S8 family peptidase [Bacillota bacterium]HOB88660.1 S8 family peptidase [Bacillota bacterium]HPZ92249.1 S8 family peptidase [Bacillota bacterium]